ncbi:putative centrosomal protein [Sesbania bispinosa]|nr:putative centrosomal protein [Sesbania bispinosa]
MNVEGETGVVPTVNVEVEIGVFPIVNIEGETESQPSNIMTNAARQKIPIVSKRKEGHKNRFNCHWQKSEGPSQAVAQGASQRPNKVATQGSKKAISQGPKHATSQRPKHATA